jgi:hypothetical protein
MHAKIKKKKMFHVQIELHIFVCSYIHIHVPSSLLPPPLLPPPPLRAIALNFTMNNVQRNVHHVGIRRTPFREPKSEKSTRKFRADKIARKDSFLDRRRITIPPRYTKIEAGTYADGQVDKVTFEKNSRLKTIGFRAFAGSALNHIEIPEGVVNIDDFAFCGCPNLVWVDLPSTLKVI